MELPPPDPDTLLLFQAEQELSELTAQLASNRKDIEGDIERLREIKEMRQDLLDNDPDRTELIQKFEKLQEEYSGLLTRAKLRRLTLLAAVSDVVHLRNLASERVEQLELQWNIERASKT